MLDIGNGVSAIFVAALEEFIPNKTSVENNNASARMYRILFWAIPNHLSDSCWNLFYKISTELEMVHL